MIKKTIIIASILTTSVFAQINENEKINTPYIDFPMKEGKGKETTEANCLICHSFGYMLNQGERSKSFWAGKVKKMKKVFKAPIAEEDMITITDYLFENYGNGKLK